MSRLWALDAGALSAGSDTKQMSRCAAVHKLMLGELDARENTGALTAHEHRDSTTVVGASDTRTSSTGPDAR